MKACPVCQSTFDDRVDFCFEDGSPLVAGPAGNPSNAPDMAAAALPEASTPSGLDAPEAVGLTERKSAAPSGAPRRSGGRGMFSRPSVADMLAIEEPGLPSPGGLPSPETSAPVSNTADVPVMDAPVMDAPVMDAPVMDAPVMDAPVMDAPEIPLKTSPEEPALPDLEGQIVPPDVTMPLPRRDRAELPAMDVDLPDMVQDPFGAEEVTEIDSHRAKAQPPAALSVPAATAVEAIAEVGTNPPLGSGAIFDAPDPTGFFEEGAGNDPLIEDPGFPDVGVSTVPEPIGYEDQPFFADGVGPRKNGVSPIWLIAGSLALVAVAILVVLAVVLGSEDDQIVVHKAPKVQATKRVVPPPVEPPAVADLAEPEEVEEPEEPEEAVVEEEEPEPEAAPVEEEPVEAVPAVPEPVEEPPPAAPEPPPPPPAPAPPPAPSAWTGTPAPPPTAPSTGSSSPWGAPTEATQRGRLTISTEPSGAMVYVDDRRVGRSPTGTEVTYGSHTVRAELDSYRTITRTVDVQVSRFSIPLRMQSASVSGTCSLMGPVGANVVMDGRSIGTLPRSVSCTQGSHRFQVTPPGGSAYTLTRDIVISEPGATVPVSLGGS